MEERHSRERLLQEMRSLESEPRVDGVVVGNQPSTRVSATELRVSSKCTYWFGKCMAVDLEGILCRVIIGSARNIK